MTTTYTVISTEGDVIARNCTAKEAAREILHDDSGDYAIRAEEDGNGWRLWTRKQVANKPWTKTVIFSLEDDEAAAEAEIYARVIAADWPRHPTAMTDERYDEQLAQFEADEARA